MSRTDVVSDKGKNGGKAYFQPRFKERAREPKVGAWRKWRKEQVEKAKIASQQARMARAEKGRMDCPLPTCWLLPFRPVYGGF